MRPLLLIAAGCLALHAGEAVPLPLTLVTPTSPLGDKAGTALIFASELEEEGHGEVPFANALGSLRVGKDARGNVRLDADADGAFTERDPAVDDGAVVRLPLRVSGREQVYAVRIQSEDDHLILLSQTVAEAEWEGLRLRFFDGDMDGRFGEIFSDEEDHGDTVTVLGADGVPTGPAQALGPCTALGAILVQVSAAEDGSPILVRHAGPTGTVALAALPEGQRVSCQLVETGGRLAVDLDARAPTATVLPGSYQVLGVRLTIPRPAPPPGWGDVARRLLGGRGGRPADLVFDSGEVEAEAPVLTVAEGARQEVALGAPFTLDFQAAVFGPDLLIRRALLRGRAGESYPAEVDACGPTWSLRRGDAVHPCGQMGYG